MKYCTNMYDMIFPHPLSWLISCLMPSQRVLLLVEAGNEKLKKVQIEIFNLLAKGSLRTRSPFLQSVISCCLKYLLSSSSTSTRFR